MSKVKSPQEKKRDSLLNDCRNTYGECPASSRKNIRRGKQLSQQALRRAVSEKLRIVKGSSEAMDVEMAQDKAQVQSLEYSRALFKKVPDTPLAVVRDRKLQKPSRTQQDSESPKLANYSEVLRSEARMLRKLRNQPVAGKPTL